MINVSRQPPPADFDRKVGAPGRRDLSDEPPGPPPVASEYWKRRMYWTRIKADLWKAYDGICAYTAHYIDPATSYSTVDHYQPRRWHPDLAYDWDNYRLASWPANRAKWDSLDVLDPFDVADHWFEIHEATLEVTVGQSASQSRHDEIEDSIRELKLNREELIDARRRYVDLYLKGDLSAGALAEEAPFLAREVARWGI